MNPYRLPDQPCVLHVSGGRSSGYLLRQVLDAHGGRLPDEAVAIFTNTGKEHEATYQFLHEIENRWGVPLIWLEYRYRAGMPGGRGRWRQKNWYERVDFETASRDGRPFSELIGSRKYLPNTVQRICTVELKVHTAARYCREEFGWRKWIDVLGIRADEQRRVNKALWEQCRSTYPMVDGGATSESVIAWWRQQPFDLRLDHEFGNCDLCFLKGVRKLRRLIAADPQRADWWIEQERLRSEEGGETRKSEMKRFLKRYTYQELRDSPMLPLAAEEDDGISCFCGD